MKRLRLFLFMLLALPTAVLAQGSSWSTATDMGLPGSVSGTLNETTTEHWYKFDVPENGTVEVHLMAHGDLSLYWSYIYVLDSGLNLHDRTAVYGGTEAEPAVMTVKDCAPGTYYIKVARNSGQGGYTMDYKFTPTSQLLPNDAEPNNQRETAHLLRRGNSLTGHMGYTYWDDRDDVDWYRIEVPKDGTVRIGLAAHGDLSLYWSRIFAVDIYNNLQERTNVHGGTDQEPSFLTLTDAAPGTYYVEVPRSGAQGCYTIGYQFVQNPYAADAEPNNQRETAIELKQGATVSGHLGYTYWDDRDDVDWYRLEMPAKGILSVTIQPDSELAIGRIGLHNAAGQGVTDCGVSGLTTLSLDNAEAGTYYVSVPRNGGKGYYLLSYAAALGTVDTDEVLPDEEQELPPSQTTDGGTVYEVDDETHTAIVRAADYDDNGDFRICSLPLPDFRLAVPYAVIIPKDNGPFSHLGSLKDIEVGVEITVPPMVEPDTFTGKDADESVLHVPEGTADDYGDDPEWGKFGTIEDDLPNPELEVTAPSNMFIVWLADGSTVAYALSEKPEVRQDGPEVTVSSATRSTLTYTWSDISKFTLGNDERMPQGILDAKTRLQVRRQAESLLFQGCQPGQTVGVYNAGGQLVDQHRIGADGQLLLPLSALPTGLYIVKSESVTIKIMKK